MIDSRIGNKERYRYDLLESTVVIEEREEKTFGLVQHFIDDLNAEQLVAVNDISPNSEDVLELIERLGSEKLEENALTYVVEDFIAEISMRV